MTESALRRHSSTIRRGLSCRLSLFSLKSPPSHNSDQERPKSRALLESHDFPSGLPRAVREHVTKINDAAPRVVGDLADELDSSAIRKLMETAERRRDSERRRSIIQLGFRLAHLTGRQRASQSWAESEKEQLLPESPTLTPELSAPSPPPPESETPRIVEKRLSMARSRNSMQAPKPPPPEVGIRVGDFDVRLRKPYIYNPLQSNRVIRLLSVRRPSVDGINGDFYYQLVTMSLDDPVPYETVSYCWGDHEQKYRINLMDGSFLMVTQSLGSELVEISSHSKTGYLWIDQMCIDQANLVEKAQQVNVMGDIYACGLRVLVSLGLPNVSLRPLFTLVDLALEYELNQRSVVDLQGALSDYMLSGGRTPRLLPPFWKAMVDLLRHPWFTRAWVFQECVLSPTIVFVFGERLVSLDPIVRLALATSRLETATISGVIPPGCVTAQPGFHQLYSIVQTRSDRAWGKPQVFWQTLSIVAPYTHCADPRDRLFAFLGLLNDDTIDVKPDYRVPHYEILTDTAKRFIEAKASLEIFSLIPRVGQEESLREGVPSWAPDWSKPEETIPLTSWRRISPFNACGGRQYGDAVLQDRRRTFRPLRLLQKQLRVKGKIIATIQNAHLEPFTSLDNWISRDLISFLRLDQALSHFTSISPPKDAYSNMSLERILKVILADGALLCDTPEFSKGVYLLDTELTDLTQAYLQFNDPELVGSAPFKLAPYARNVYSLRNLSRVAVERRLIMCDDGRLGLVHNRAQEGDVIAVLHGSRTPVVFQPRADGKFEIKGQCYFEDSMHGESIFWEEDEADEFIVV
ncbi:HET-domain-containing protein [Venturia nashicola]|uniref:HET-domain-containing protein n=1 Tax=Venturia nashicola TaxID=86259 RepID=A0A4Z1NX86_9PEZI|nr:HET-domain-containing protein [Venturia nashicola]TLD27743.1 HET-domain-containing protein [Venturia nashicola]